MAKSIEGQHDRKIVDTDSTIGTHCFQEALNQMRDFLDNHEDGLNAALLSAPKGKTKVKFTVNFSIEGEGVHVEVEGDANIKERMQGVIISEKQMSLPFKTADGVTMQLYTDPNRGAGVGGQA